MTDLQSFKMYLIRKGLASSSVDLYVSFIERFFNKYKINQVENFIMDLIESGQKATYININITSLRQYGNFINNKKLKSIKFLKLRERTKGILQDQEIEDFLKLPPPENLNKNNEWHYYKMSLFWMCLAYSGARCSEISTMNCRNSVDFGRNVFIVNGKMGERIIPINPVLVDPLKKHISQLKGELLFPSQKTKRPIEKATWNKDFHRRINRLGLKRDNLTPYSLRHSFVTRMLDTEGVNVFQVQSIVGHRQLSTTQGYYHLTHKKIVNTIKRDPLSRGSMNYFDRLKAVREGVRLLLGDYTLSIQEEKKMIKDLF